MPFPLADEQDYDCISNIYVHVLLELFLYSPSRDVAVDNMFRRSGLSIFLSTDSCVNKGKLFSLDLGSQFIKGGINHPLRTPNSLW